VNFYEKYVEMCNNIGKSPSAVSLEIGLSKSTVNRWKKGGNPTDATAAKIASYFGVSVTYLLGKEEQKNPTTKNDSGITKTKSDLIKRVMQMSDEELQKFELLLQIVESK
jgi:transcriptional regulator with XRE-family HTH domain